MKTFLVRLDEELLAGMKERAGERGTNQLVVALIEEWLARTSGGADIKRPTDIMPPAQPDIVAGYLCSYWTRGKTCGRPATHFKGRLARCDEH